MPGIPALLDACRVPDTVPSGQLGPWCIKRRSVDPKIADSALVRDQMGYRGDHTVLLRVDAPVPAPSWENLHREWEGEIVMEDCLQELRRHLPILLKARGRVLVSGLGLGCVVRGLLSKPEVEHVDCVEIDTDIIRMVGRSFTFERLTIHEGDAERIEWPEGARWDYAWHDVHSMDEALPLVHARLIYRYMDRCEHQGAWQLPRYMRRQVPGLLDGRRR